MSGVIHTVGQIFQKMKITQFWRAILNTFHKVGQLCVQIVWRINQNVAGGGGGGGAGVGVGGRGVIRDFGCSW